MRKVTLGYRQVIELVKARADGPRNEHSGDARRVRDPTRVARERRGLLARR